MLCKSNFPRALEEYPPEWYNQLMRGDVELSPEGIAPREMPVMRPVPIPTKSVNWFIGLWRWVTVIRMWRLEFDWSYHLPNGITINIPAGFEFDGASVPSIFWSILSPTGLLLIPGLIHDFAYKHDYLLSIDWAKREVVRYQEGAGREFWDRLFRDVSVSVNGFMPIFYAAWFALRIGGWVAWRNHRRHDKERMVSQ